jgi:hypothetical protein
MKDTRRIVALTLKALAITMAALSFIFIVLGFTGDYLYIAFLAIGVTVLSVSSIVEHKKILYW